MNTSRFVFAFSIGAIAVSTFFLGSVALDKSRTASRVSAVSLFSSVPPPPWGVMRPPPPPGPSADVDDTEYGPNIDAELDMAILALEQPKIGKRDQHEGFFLPFTINNGGTRKYQTTVNFICEDFQKEENILLGPGVSRQTIFFAFQDAESTSNNGMRDLRAGKKSQMCGLSIATVGHINFDDSDEPTDNDPTNNGARFILAMKKGVMVLSDARPDVDNQSELVKRLRQPLSAEEQAAYRALAQEQCLNILIASEDRGIYYNGEMIDPGVSEPGPRSKISQAHIAGDRLAYVRDTSVIVDGENVGLTNANERYQTPRDANIKINEKHYAYFRLMSYDRETFAPIPHLIYDGEDLGEADVIDYKLNGDYIIYQRRINRQIIKTGYQLFVNGKKVANGAYGDYDGKNLAYVDIFRSDQMMYNGKKQGYGGEVSLKDGHFVFTWSKTSQGAESRVIYDGKNLGRGRDPIIEKKHLSYIRARAEIDPRSDDQHPKVIYDGKEYGYVGGMGWKVSLAGDHRAYLRKLERKEWPFVYSKDFVRINIDGKDYPGDFLSDFFYLEITEKTDRSGCAAP